MTKTMARKAIDGRVTTHTQDIVSRRKRDIFLKVLRETGKVVEAAKAAGYGDSTFLRRVYKDDSEFAQLWEEAVEAAYDRMEDEAVRRARDGILDPVYYKGEIAGYRLNYSDQLLMFLLRGARPEKFRDNVKIDATINARIGVAVMPKTAPSIEAWEQTAAQVAIVQGEIKYVDKVEPALVIENAGQSLKRV